MAMLTVRKLPDEIHRGLAARAEKKGHSMESEVREILYNAVLGAERVKLGTVLQEISQEAGLTAEDLKIFETIRDQTPARAVRFE
jgi:plasmid stability protein